MSQNKLQTKLSPGADSAFRRGSRSTEASSESGRARIFVVGAALLALFLGALDALVVGAAMPTIVSDLGGMHLYSWVFSSYLLTRAISLPIFGKLCDLFSRKKLYLIAVSIFLAASMLAGASAGMTQLILFRALQGVGAGGSFALVYIVVSDLSSPENRGKMMGLISFVWGIASVLGPALGGFIVTYSSWRWIFYINVPLGGLALLGIALFLKDTRSRKGEAAVDYLGALTLSLSILALLMAFMLAGGAYSWLSPEIAGLLALAAAAGVGFWYAERRAKEPILALHFFRNRGFSMGNGAAFFCSFAIFSLSAYTPLYIQGALGKTPAQLGLAMVPLSLGWSGGALICGQLVKRSTEKSFSLFGACLLILSTGLALSFSTSTPLWACAAVFAAAGLGMGFVSIGTLLIVQNSLDESDLGVATSAHQFSRTLGGTIGIGVSGGLVTVHLSKTLDALMGSPLMREIPSSVLHHVVQNIQDIFQSEMQATLPPDLVGLLQKAVGDGVKVVFWATLAMALVSLFFCFLLPKADGKGR